MNSYLIDCGACQADRATCGSCLVSFIAEPSYGEPVRFSEEERGALETMVEAGLIPQLRLVAA